MKGPVCGLCREKAVLYCEADSAFLCSNCDCFVHGANFLVARHVRQLLCPQCKNFAGKCVSGAGVQLRQPLCQSCSPEIVSPFGEEDDCLSSSSSSACVLSAKSLAPAPVKIRVDNQSTVSEISSEAEFSGPNSGMPVRNPGEVSSAEKKRKEANSRSIAAPKVDSKAEAIFVNWSRRLGLDSNIVVPAASTAFGWCLVRLTSVPFRVRLAASFWLGLRMCGDRSLATCQNLRRVEAVSGVPAKLIVVAQAKLARGTRKEKESPRKLAEGWAECSP